MRAAAAVAVLALAACGGDSRGPLAPPEDTRAGVSAPVDVGERVSMGLIIPTNSGEDTVVLERLEPIEMDPGMRLVGVGMTDGPSHVGLISGYPPDGRRLHELEGFAIEPGAQDGVVVGLAVTREGRHSVRAFRLYYRVGDDRYDEVWTIGVRLCAPKEEMFGRCPAR